MEGFTYKVTFLITFGLIAALAARSSRKVQSADDYAVAGRSLSASGVAWIIIGTLVGGMSTVGTVQAAYDDGFIALIFTFGSGLSCLLLGLFFARGLRQEGVVTVSEYLGRYFGSRFRLYCSALNSTGMFIQVISQFLAAIAILQAVFRFGSVVSVCITLMLMTIFVGSGGIAGAGLIGRVKLYMLYLIMVLSAGVAWYQGGGTATILAGLPQDRQMLGLSHYGLRPALVDLASMVVGVLSTQVYLQAIFSARDVREARNGALLSAALIPPIGILGLMIGLYLRANFPELSANSAQALPFFFYHSFPPVMAAFFSAGILLIVLGTGAGLVLGVTTNLYNDFLTASSRATSRCRPLLLLRMTTLLVLAGAALLVFTGLDSTILKWSYLSMGLRGSAVFLGLLLALFLSRKSDSLFLRGVLYVIPIGYLLLNFW
jgi:SSS family solute:Na+ symporter